MKFLPLRQGGTVIETRLPEWRFAFKNYVETTYIPGILKYDGAEVMNSIFWNGRKFFCDLYNELWNQYAKEKPFSVSDFQLYEGESDTDPASQSCHMIQYVKVPILPGTEQSCTCALAFTFNYGKNAYYTDIHQYRIQRTMLGDRVHFEAFCSDGHVGCLPSMSKNEASTFTDEVVKLVWSMSFDEDFTYGLERAMDA